MWYTTGVLFLFSRHIIRIDVMARVFSSFYPSRKKKKIVIFESLNDVCKQTTLRNVKGDNSRCENTSVDDQPSF